MNLQGKHEGQNLFTLQYHILPRGAPLQLESFKRHTAGAARPQSSQRACSVHTQTLSQLYAGSPRRPLAGSGAEFGAVNPWHLPLPQRHPWLPYTAPQHGPCATPAPRDSWSPFCPGAPWLAPGPGLHSPRPPHYLQGQHRLDTSSLPLLSGAGKLPALLHAAHAGAVSTLAWSDEARGCQAGDELINGRVGLCTDQHTRSRHAAVPVRAASLATVLQAGGPRLAGRLVLLLDGNLSIPGQQGRDHAYDG